MIFKARFLIFALFANLWIYKIFANNILVAILTLTTSVFLFATTTSKPKKHLKLFFALLFTVLLFAQFTTTYKTSLTHLDNDQKRVQQMRLHEYPPVSIKLLNKTIWLPLAHWFEGRKESIALFRIQDNFSQVIDPMLYFFANHPRERVGYIEFEKFPFILLPIFIVGILTLLQKSKKRTLLVSLFVPITLLSFIGSKNAMGPFSLFPFLSVTIAYGSALVANKLKNLSKTRRAKVYFVLALIFTLVLLQTISYAKY